MTPSWRTEAAQALAAYREELAAAGIAPLETSDEQEAELQRLAGEILKEELAARV